jgi:hypothetical protein
MHCRLLSCPTNNDSIQSSFFSTHSDYTHTLNHRICSSSVYHDQLPAPRRRRRLEDPVITPASNYYVINPRQTSHSPSPSSQTPSLSLLRRLHHKSEDKNIYCDLFNLLERPPPIKQRKKYISNDSDSCHGHRSIVYKNIHTKTKDINERKRHQKRSSYYKEKTHQKEKLSSVQQYDQLEEKTKNNKCIYQQHLSSKGFFRRVVNNYFCMPMTVTNREFSN